MRFMLLRRSTSANEAGAAPSPAALAALDAYAGAMSGAGILRAFDSLLPSAHGVRLSLSGGEAGIVAGPFTQTRELIAAFAVIDVPDKQEALAWLRRWPAEDDGAEVELREGGCPGGCAEIQPADGAEVPGQRFAVLLRSSRALEDEVPVAQSKLDALDGFNAIEAKKGALLAADGLRSSALGTRLKLGAGKLSLVDGPFTEIKEMIAGYWLIRVASLDEAIAWARRAPYPCSGEVEIEIRELAPQHAAPAAFTPELRAAEQRIRTQQLESGMQAQLSARAPAWR